MLVKETQVDLWFATLMAKQLPLVLSVGEKVVQSLVIQECMAGSPKFWIGSIQAWVVKQQALPPQQLLPLLLHLDVLDLIGKLTTTVMTSTTMPNATMMVETAVDPMLTPLTVMTVNALIPISRQQPQLQLLPPPQLHLHVLDLTGMLTTTVMISTTILNVTMTVVIVVEPMSIQPTVRNVNALIQILQLLQLHQPQPLIPPAMMILLGAAIVHTGLLLDFALIKTMHLSCNPFAKRVVDFVNLLMRWNIP